VWYVDRASGLKRRVPVLRLYDTSSHGRSGAVAVGVAGGYRDHYGHMLGLD